MNYSDDYLRRVLPEQEPPAEHVPPEVDEEIKGWIERDEIESKALIARSTRWTYAIANELRLNQVEVDWRHYPYWPFNDPLQLLRDPLAIGLFDPDTEDKGFGLVLHLPPGTEVIRGHAAEVRFPRLRTTVPLRFREAIYEDHHPIHPALGTSAAWARCDTTGLWGVMTAGHVVRTMGPGRTVPFENGAAGRLMRSCFPHVDCAFVLTDAPPQPPTLLSTRRFAAAGHRVTVECKSGSQPRTVTEVETNMHMVSVRSYDIKVFLDEALSHGDSGALVKTTTNEAVGIYLGALATPAVPTGLAGRALNFEQALYALGVTAYR
ncbi:hypothetical protein [Brevundimonas sp. A19_0]|uniref:hypothetical protein n=1 Tax=Brevundimonas sp. A19_0 TaxID=2821087 RepID=UPI001ADACBB3|nr:hypothetical protein [Brevundimonas sp. A19_0]MBO9502546.1 hypothetical protein [Brevundimonas sp. A19_0]